jgi:hypothetical protein
MTVRGFSFVYKGYDCFYSDENDYERVVFQPLDTAIRGGFHNYPLAKGTLEYVGNDYTVVMDHLLTNEPVDAILAKRQFDKDLEKLLDE